MQKRALRQLSVMALLILAGLGGWWLVAGAPAVHAAPSLAALAQETTTYTVQRGDTLSAIARRFGMTVVELMRLNGITNPNLIRVGQTLTVRATATPTPGSPTATPTTAATTVYVVQRGDTLSAIARRFGTTTTVLIRLNGLTSANYIYVGQRLRVPGPAGSEEPAPTRINFAPGSTAATVTGTVTFPNRVCYVLGAQAGQTLNVTITSPGELANFLVRAADASVNGGVPLKRLESEARTVALELPVTGDYIICVATPEGTVNFSLTVAIPVVSTCSPLDQALRSTDWATLLTTDTALTHEMIGSDHYVTVIGAATEVAGIPQLDQIVYGDFDTDCGEEAGIPLFSGGTAGNVGFLVYDNTTPAPTLVASGFGYKLGLAVEGDLLVVSNALYNGWEPNCCPSGRTYDRYHLAGSSLTLVSNSTEGFVEMQQPTVEQFYNLLAARDFTNAYALLAADFQAANPFAAWEAGYADTESFTATVTPDASTPDRVLVELAVTERLSSGATRIRHYSGHWDLVWNGSAPGWQLHAGSFVVVP